jgi:hypothetical protein
MRRQCVNPPAQNPDATPGNQDDFAAVLNRDGPRISKGIPWLFPRALLHCKSWLQAFRSSNQEIHHAGYFTASDAAGIDHPRRRARSASSFGWPAQALLPIPGKLLLRSIHVNGHVSGAGRVTDGNTNECGRAVPAGGDDEHG